VKAYLSQNGIAYTEYDISMDKEKAREMVKLSGAMAVPVTIVDGQVLVGYNQGKLDEVFS